MSNSDSKNPLREVSQTSTGSNLQGADAISNRLLLRVSECAELTGLPRSTIYVLLASGQLPSIKIGRARRIRTQDLLAWIDGKPTSY